MLLQGEMQSSSGQPCYMVWSAALVIVTRMSVIITKKAARDSIFLS